MEKKKILIISIIFIILIVSFSLFFLINHYKFFHFGNNMSSKSAKQIAEYILNISSYKAKIEVEVKSNKNTNRYILEQEFISPDITTQVVVEPQNIKDLKIVLEEKTLRIENTRLNLKTIYENYNYISENNLFLNSFIEDYKACLDSKTEETENEVIMTTKVKDGHNKYAIYKKLYINHKTGDPTKLEVQDVNQNTTVYILYNEININSINKEEILAFRLNEILLNDI